MHTIYDFLSDYTPTNITILRLDESNCGMSGDKSPARTVAKYEFDFITWGKGHIVTDGHQLPVVANRLFIRNPGLQVQGVAPYHCYWLTFDLIDSAGKLYDAPLPFPNYHDFDHGTNLELFFENIYQAYLAQNALHPFIFKTMISNIFLELVKKQRLENTEKNLPISQIRRLEGLKLTKEHMLAHPEKHFTLNDLAAIAGLSPYHFSRVFKETYGASPIKYMNNQRLIHIKKVLIGTDKSIKEIMVDTGFYNESYFYKLFKDHTGMTPEGFRHVNRIHFS